MKRNFLLLLFLQLFFFANAQQRTAFTLNGTVYDETGSTLPGATVFLKDQVGIGTITDIDGKFSINVKIGDVVVISFVGLETAEYVIVKKESDIEIRMNTESEELDELVVIGMGSQRRISSLAAVTSVDVKDLQTPVASVANLLGGKVPGVISMQTSGEPGKNISEFWIRGIGTFGASSGALVLIDGLEGDINSIDPADIQSFSVLKDASATAVYGVRGANGVVLVTTKRGEAGKLSITSRTNFSLSVLRRIPEYLGAYDYAKLVNEALSVRGSAPAYNDVDLDIIRYRLDNDLYPDVNWQDEILNNHSFEQSYYVSARGGGEVARYFLSLGLSDETAAYKQDKSSVYSSNVGYNTYNYRLNIDLNLTRTTGIYFGTDGYLAVRSEPGMANTDYIWNAQSQLNPLLFPSKYSNGLLPAAGANDLSSPYVLINHTGQSSGQNYQGKITMAVNQDLKKVIDGLKLKVQGAYDIHSIFGEQRYVQPALFQALGRNTNGSLIMKENVQAVPARYSKQVNQYRKYHFETTLNYEKLLADDHRFTGLLYYYLSDEKATTEAVNSLAAIPLRYQGVSSRLTYSFKDTYMMDVNFGYTGSENFQPGKQYGFFPSIALGWSPTNYELVKNNLPWLNFFKIRASYGTVGNDRITSRRFPYLTMVNIGQNSIWGGNNVETINETIVGADNLKWEKALKKDLGFEGRLFDDKIEFVVDFFDDQRDGIFQPRVQVPDYVGVISMPYGNVGKMKSYGSDGNISFSHQIDASKSFVLRGNYTYSTNLIQNWEQLYLEYPYLEYTGYPYNVIRGFQSLGLFKDEDDIKYSPRQQFGDVAPGDIKYKDINADGVINDEDKVPLSYSTYPRLMYGFGGEFRYKSFTLGVMFKGTGKTDFFHVGQSGNGMGYVPFHGGATGNVLTIINDPSSRWIPREYAAQAGIDPSLAENPGARFPRLQYGYNSNNSQLSDFWKGDARYLRLQEVTLNYNLKLHSLRRIGVSSLDLQLAGTNLFVWDKVKLFDPEQARYNGRAYPIPSVFTFQLYINI
jgi:TonB-linked SusC/RagA family outer membrane protein